MTFPTVVGVGTDASGTGSITPGLPTGWTPGDIHLLCVATANEAVAAPSGWTETAGSPQGTGTTGAVNAARVTVFWRRAESGDTGPTVTDPGDHCVARILGLRDCLPAGNPWDAAAGRVEAVSIGTATYADVATTVDNCLIVYVNAFDYDIIGTEDVTVVNAALANITTQSVATYPVGNGSGLAIITGEKATAGAIGSGTVTWHVGLARAGFHGLITLSIPAKAELICDSGVYAISGTPCDLQADFQIACDAGIYMIAGTAITLHPQHVYLSVDPGVYGVSSYGICAAPTRRAGTTQPFCECCVTPRCEEFFPDLPEYTGITEDTVPCTDDRVFPPVTLDWPIDKHWKADGGDAYIIVPEGGWSGCDVPGSSKIAHDCNPELEPGGPDGAEVVFTAEFHILPGVRLACIGLAGSYSADNYVKAGEWKVNGRDQAQIDHGSYLLGVQGRCIDFFITPTEGGLVVGLNTIEITVKNGNITSGIYGGPMGLELVIGCSYGLVDDR